MGQHAPTRASRGGLAAIAGLGALLLVAGCSGGGSASPATAKTSTSTTSSSTTTDAGGTSTSAGTTGGNGDVTVEVDGLDASKAPDLLVARTYNPYSLYHLDHPGGTATLITGGKDSTLPYLLNPLATLVATIVQGDAVNKATVTLVDTKTGKQVAKVQPDAQQVRLIGWSPDGSAVLFNANSGGPDTYRVLRADGSSAVLPKDIYLDSSSGSYDVAWVRTKAGAAPLELPQDAGAPVQFLSSKGVPVTVVSYNSYRSNSRAGLLTEGGLQPFAGVASQAQGRSGSTGWDYGNGTCPRFGVLHADLTGGSEPPLLYDSDTNRIYDIPQTSSDGQDCPLVSHSGTRVALPGSTGTGVVVVDLSNGKLTTVSRQGKPIAWSKDDTKLLVSGGGTFVVAADGSGGKKASVDVQSACVVGAKGQVLAAVVDATTGQRDLVLYDIASDSARTIGPGQINGRCEISSDGRWLLEYNTLVDLESAQAGTVTVKTASGSTTSGTLHFAGPSVSEPAWTAD